MVFMGEEWAATTPFQFFTDFEDPAMKQAVTEGRRREFEAHGWAAEDVPDPQDERDLPPLAAGLGGAARG